MSKRGDSYLRTLLIHGTRSVIYRVRQKAGPTSWLNQLIQRRNPDVAAVALANKNARIAWALIAHDRRDEFNITANSRRFTPLIAKAINEVMATQVRPWLAQPAPDEAPTVRVSDRGAIQLIPSGTAAESRNQSTGCTGAIFTFESS